MNLKKPIIEAIYPLSSMQQGFLFHHLMKADDQGFLISQCIIEGDLDIEQLQAAWKLVTMRHDIMRTSVHWKKIKRPVLLVRPEKEIDWSFLDWSKTPLNRQGVDLETYKKERKAEGVVFDKNPLSKISLIKKTDTTYYLLWECHHLLLDGWSAIIIIRDAFKLYEGLKSGVAPQLQAVPSLKSYNNWLKNNSLENASDFWIRTFKGFKHASVFQEHSNQASIATPQIHTYRLEKQVSEGLKSRAKACRVTLNTLCQGIWSIALARYFNTNDVIFGNTVSGRSIPFPNIELMAGMFANALPVRTILEPSSSFQSCLQLIQSQQQEARNYEYCKLDQISKWANISASKTLFDSLFIFYKPWDDITYGKVKVRDFESGLTTTYPITATFKVEDCIHFEMLINTNIIPSKVIDWFLEVVPTICNVILDNGDCNINVILSKVPMTPSEGK